MNCPRCNAILKPSKISCPKCGKIYRVPIPKRLLKRERMVTRLEASDALSHHKNRAREALEFERLNVGA